MKIVIDFIPHEKQRYPTCGDWYWDKNGTLNIKVSNLDDWKKEVLIAVHELVEVLICRADDIPQKEVDEFDMKYEKDRENGLHGPYDEPGDDPESPYRDAHFSATNIERILSTCLGVNWQEYEKKVAGLP